MDYIVFKDFRKYIDRVGLLHYICYFTGLDIEPDCIFGSFLPHRLDELIEFCRKNPDYHIVSLVGDDIQVNRFEKNADLYKLAEGDRDPRIMFCQCWVLDQIA